MKSRLRGNERRKKTAQLARSHLRRWCLPVGRYRTHYADGDTVGILDDGVARPPERVDRRLQAPITGSGHVAVHRIDIGALRYAEADDNPAFQVWLVLPAGIPALRERGGVEI